jgi:hypothetical protein
MEARKFSINPVTLVEWTPLHNLFMKVKYRLGIRFIERKKILLILEIRTVTLEKGAEGGLN